MLELLLCSLVTILPDYLFAAIGRASASAKRSLSIRSGTN